MNFTEDERERLLQNGAGRRMAQQNYQQQNVQQRRPYEYTRGDQCMSCHSIANPLPTCVWEFAITRLPCPEGCAELPGLDQNGGVGSPLHEIY